MGDIYHRGIMYDEREVNDMIKVAICDDEDSIIQEMERIIETSAHEYGIQIESEVFYDGEQLIRYMNRNEEQFDLFFLDIEMKGMNGIETAIHIREHDRKGLIVYVTSHESYALEAYQVHPFDFLVKPLQEEKVRRCFEQAYTFLVPEERYFEYKFNKVVFQLPIKNIMYFKSSRRTIEIHMFDDTVKKYYGKLDETQKMLDKSNSEFWRIHQSILVNADYVYRKAYDYVELINGKLLSISPDCKKELNRQYVQRIMDKEKDK